MPDNRRSPRTILACVLAVPVFAAMYVAVFGGRLCASLRPALATVLGLTVIGSVYADEALKRAPATPMRAVAVLALAIAVVGTGVAPRPAAAAGNPAEAVIAAARGYLGSPYRLGAEGPRVFDCSGLIFRVFSDVGELPRIGGMRLRAAGYMRWFVSRGLFTRDEGEAARGDLVIYQDGEHMGIYLGEGKVLSALINPWGVSVHSLHGVNERVDYFLQVNWSNGDNPPPDPGNGDGTGGNPGGGGASGTNPGETPGDPMVGDDPSDPGIGGTDHNGPPNDMHPEGGAGNRGSRAITTGTVSLRDAADPQGRVVGWLGRGRDFKIVDIAHSPSGWLWYRIETVSGKQGWVWSFWTRPL